MLIVHLAHGTLLESQDFSVTCISFFCRRLHWYLLDIVFYRVLGFAAVVQGCEDF